MHLISSSMLLSLYPSAGLTKGLWFLFSCFFLLNLWPPNSIPTPRSEKKVDIHFRCCSLWFSSKYWVPHEMAFVHILFLSLMSTLGSLESILSPTSRQLYQLWSQQAYSNLPSVVSALPTILFHFSFFFSFFICYLYIIF